MPVPCRPDPRRARPDPDSVDSAILAATEASRRTWIVPETTELTQATSINAGVRLLLDELAAWLDDARDRHLALDWQGIHDEATFVTAWAGYHAYTGDERVKQLALDLFAKWRRWAKSNLVHGYFPRQEVHHGTEHYIIFLDWLCRIAPEREDVAIALDDGAHHVGNWGEGTPDWYDPERNRFLSYDLGTVRTGCEGFNFVDHMRMVHLAMAAWHATRGDRYLDLAQTYTRTWADAIVESTDIPLYLDPDLHSQTELEQLLHSFLKAAPQQINGHARVENHVASGTPKALLDVWRATNDDRCHRAALKLARACVPYLASPVANPAGHILSLMLRAEANPGTLGLDDKPFPDADEWRPLDGCSMTIQTDPGSPWQDSLGYRFDLPAWQLRDGTGNAMEERPAPGNLVLAWELSGREQYALDACTIALGRLRLARNTFRDGRHHGCTAQSIAATVRGHGRCWGIGDVSAVLANPAIQAAFGLPPGTRTLSGPTPVTN